MASKRSIQDQADLRESHLLKRIEGLVKTHEMHKTIIDELERQIIELNSESDTLIDAHVILKTQLDSLKQKLAKSEDRLNYCHHCGDNIEKVFKRQLVESKREVKEAQARSNLTSQRADDYLEIIKELKAKIEELDQELEEAKECKNKCEVCGEINCQGGMYEIKDELTEVKEGWRDTSFELNKQLTEVREELESAKRRLAYMHESDVALTQELSDLKDDHLTTIYAHMKLEEEKNEIEIAYKTYRDHTMEQVEELTKSNDWLHEEHEKLRNKIIDL